MQAILQLLAVSFVPCVILLVAIYRLDKYEPEKIGAIVGTFLVGMLSYVPAHTIELLASRLFLGGSRSGAVHDFLIVAPVEELLKLGVIVVIARVRSWFDEPLDWLIYGWTAALGFAAAENAAYLFEEPGAYFWARALLASPAHPLFTGLMGWALGVWRFDRRGPAGLLLVVAAVLQAILVHGLYDVLVSTETLSLGLAVTLLVALVGINGIYWHRLVEASPFRFSYLPKGVRTMRQDVVVYTWQRWKYALWFFVLFGACAILAGCVLLVVPAAWCARAGTGIGSYVSEGGCQALTALTACRFEDRAALDAHGLALAGLMGAIFLAIAVAWGALSRGRASQAMMMPALAALLATTLVVCVSSRSVGMWFMGFHEAVAGTSCTAFKDEAASGFFVTAIYGVLGLGCAGGLAGHLLGSAVRRMRAKKA